MVGNRSRSTQSSSSSEAGAAPDRVEGEVIPPTRQRGASRDLDGRKVLARFVGVVARVPRYLRLGWLLLQDPTVSGRGKAALGGGLAYALSPIDAVPGFIPVLGQLDDLAALLLGIRVALGSAPTEVAERHLRDVGLSWDALERDIVTIRATTVWLTRRGGALAARVGRAMLRAASRQVRSALAGRGRDTAAEPS
jgi:uncharacterized membrane protein YkvA (DUF1232 family)